MSHDFASCVASCWRSQHFGFRTELISHIRPCDTHKYILSSAFRVNIKYIAFVAVTKMHTHLFIGKHTYQFPVFYTVHIWHQDLTSSNTFTVICVIYLESYFSFLLLLMVLPSGRLTSFLTSNPFTSTFSTSLLKSPVH